MQVGTDVPIITSQQATNITTGGNSSVLQSVQYRQTGIILKIRPVVYGDNRVELDISQEVSNEQDNSNAAIASPLILNRSITSRLSLAEGVTAVLGGLIDNNYTKGDNGIPLLKDVPIVGNAFRTDTISGTKTNLIILLTPYIIRDTDDMAKLTDHLSAEMDRAFKVGQGFSYTLLPYSTGVNLAITAPPARISTSGNLKAPANESSAAPAVSTKTPPSATGPVDSPPAPSVAIPSGPR